MIVHCKGQTRHFPDEAKVILPRNKCYLRTLSISLEGITGVTNNFSEKPNSFLKFYLKLYFKLHRFQFFLIITFMISNDIINTYQDKISNLHIQKEVIYTKQH